jgi:hypothetical protein
MESRLGLKRGEVLNLAMGGDNIYDALLTYERSRDQLRGTGIVVVQVDPFQFNVGRPPPARLRRYATWRERKAYRETRHRWSIWLDFLFRSEVSLQPLGVYIRQWLTDGEPPAEDSVDVFGRLAVVRIANDHDPMEFSHSRLESWLQWQYMDYFHAPELEHALLRLIDMAHEDGAKVVIVGMPTVPRYQEMLSAFPGDPQAVFQNRVRQILARRADGLAFWSTPESAELSVTHFRDWGHLNTAGAIVWSDFFARWLIDEEPVLLASWPMAEKNREANNWRM